MADAIYIPKLGDEVKHRVTGMKGIVVTISQHLHGCNTIYFKPQTSKYGKPAEMIFEDENAVELVKAAKVPPSVRYQPRQHDGAVQMPGPDRPRMVGRVIGDPPMPR